MRFYTTGWAFRFGLMQIRWNKQENYKGLSLEWIGQGYNLAGGISWKEFRAQRRAQAVSKDLARAKHNAAILDPLPGVSQVLGNAEKKDK